MDVELKYGSGHLKLAIPDRAEVIVLNPSPRAAIQDLAGAVSAALDSPRDSLPLEGRPNPKRVAVAVPDTSRPTPTKVILPVLLDRLFKAFPDLAAERVSVVVGAGLHPPLDQAGLERVVPQAIRRGVRVVSHDALNSEFRDFGRTSRGTPIRINALVAQADLKLAIGQIDPHQFVGFTGGAKGVVIGCGAAETIERNHGLMFHPQAQAGILDGNPVREDQTEAGRIVGLDLAVNVVLDPDKRAVFLAAGSPATVLRAGAQVCAGVYGVEIKEKFDLAVASCGGAPKDICLYQAQKGLNLASQGVKPGGKILLLAACPEGVGDEVYLDYVSRFPDPQAALADFQRLGFKMGAHKCFLFSRTLAAFEVAVHSDLDRALLRRCHLRPADAQATIDQWVEGFPGRPRVAVVPNANTTYFYTPETRPR